MFKKFNFYLRVYLGFSKREARGFSLLIPVLILFYAVPLVYERLVSPAQSYPFRELVDAELLEANPVDSLKQGQVGASIHLTAHADSVPVRGQRREVDYSNRKLDFSEADSVTLQIVPGIGKVMAARIIRFRDGMGGLHAKEQLFDVYGMEEPAFEKLWEYFSFKPQPLTKLQINDVAVDELARHPYVSFGQAKVIVAFREQHGNFSSAEDLLKIKILNPNWVDRLKPYLSFD